MSTNDMKDRICTLSKNDLKDLVKTYCIPLDIHPHLPDPGFTMEHLPNNATGIYTEFLWFSSIRIPFSTFLLSILKYFKVHISQLVPLGLNKVVSFEVVCRDLNIIPTVTLFCVFQCLCKQGDWFYFSKRLNTEDVCMYDGPSSLKKWKEKFFLIDRRAIPDYLTWRHSCSSVSDDLPPDGYDQNDVERLCAQLICLREIREEVLVRSGLKMSIYYFMTLPSWGDAKVAEEAHHLSLPLLELVPLHTTASAAKGAMISLPTPDEIVASLLDPRLAKKSSEAGSSASELGQAEGVDEADLTDFCAEIENSLERDECTSSRAASTPTPHIGKRLGAPPSVADVSAFGPSHGRTLVHASTFSRGLSLGGAVVSGYAGKSEAEVLWLQVDSMDSLARSALTHDVEYDWIPKDDFGSATRGEEIDLTLFPLTPGPYQMSYLYEGASSLPYTREEWNGGHAPEVNPLCKDILKDPDICQKALDRTITPAELKRTESLLPLDLANRFNVLSALLVSYGAELNSHYTGLVSPRNHLQENFDRKAGYVKVLCSKVTDLDGKLERMQKDCDALVQENRELCSQKDVASIKVQELQTKLTDARVASICLSEEFDEFHAALACVASLGINYGFERGLRMGRTDVEFEAAIQKVPNFHVRAKADFDKALVDFPTTPFPFLNKIVAAYRGTLSEVTQVLPNKHIRSVIPASAVLSIVNEDADQVLLEHTSGASTASI
ncbi:hypothetical protein Tco_0723826 [Tanacetum coccineum]